MTNLIKSILLAATVGGFSGPAAASTLDDVKANGFFTCGVSQGNPGFSNPDNEGNWSGLDVDYCRAVAAAVLGDPEAVKFRPLSSPERFTALQSGEIDLLSRTTTWTMSRDTNLGANFAGVMYYDGQAMMVRKELGITSAMELAGASVCTATGTTTELNVADFFRVNKMEYEVVAFEKNDEVTAAYDAGRCDVYTTDKSGLHANRLKLTNPSDHMILPEVISKEPLGPVVRQGDDQWFNIAKWTLNVLINAEELGVTQANVEEMKGSDNPAVKRLLGIESNFGEALGLNKDWAVRIIGSIGNYGEVFARNVGVDTPLGIERGLNASWTDGGILYAPPVR
ncbi:amino acid ABC transporter substrate-binding protein [Roseibium sp.]|uniref:amino acid ABC transporter substrate-binding protein n=1 Tax=Roseibium sp. TaxID=1936156 RepID=UPI003B51D0A7